MTYRELKESMKLLTEEQLDQNITVYDIEADECFQVNYWIISGLDKYDLPLDDGHAVLCIKGEMQ